MFSFSITAEAALNCYTSADDMSIKEECGMQTGCIKKFYKKSKLWQEKHQKSPQGNIEIEVWFQLQLDRSCQGRI